MAASNAGIDAGDFAIGHQLSFFERLLDAVYRGIDVDYHAALEPAAGRRAKTCQTQAAVGQHLGHYRHHFGGSDVQSND